MTVFPGNIKTNWQFL